MPIPMPKGMPMMPGLVGLTPTSVSFCRGDVDPRRCRRRSRASIVRLAGWRHAGSLGDARAAHDQRRTFAMYGFNGQVPGPLIRVPQNATIIVRFHNRIDLPSAVHWHGVRLDNRFDGVPGVTQEPSAGRQLRLRVHFPTRASTGITRTCARTSSRRWVCSATCSSIRRTRATTRR